MARKHQRVRAAIFANPVSANIKWRDIEALLKHLGCDIEQRAGSRVAVVVKGEVNIFHRPHPSPNTDKGAVMSVRALIERHQL